MKEGREKVTQTITDRKTIVFVCTANRGRSPIAEAILKDILSKNGANGRISVESAGLCTHEIGRTGMPASEDAARVCRSHGLDLSSHSAQPVSPELIEMASVVVVMERWQKEVLSQAFPNYTGKVITLSELGGTKETQDMVDIAGKPVSEVEDFFQKAENYLASSWRGLIESSKGDEART